MELWLLSYSRLVNVFCLFQFPFFIDACTHFALSRRGWTWNGNNSACQHRLLWCLEINDNERLNNLWYSDKEHRTKRCWNQQIDHRISSSLLLRFYEIVGGKNSSTSLRRIAMVTNRRNKTHLRKYENYWKEIGHSLAKPEVFMRRTAAKLIITS